MTAKHFDVLTPLVFLKDIEAEAKKAKKRVWAQAMEVEPGKYSGRLLSLVENAAAQGLDARLNIDCYSLMVTDGVPNYLPVLKPGRWGERLQERKKVFHAISEKGGHIAYINHPTLLERLVVTMGRNHMKIVVIDDIAWVGGVNFADGYFKRRDLMVKITDKTIVEPIARVFMEAHKETLRNDEELKAGHHATLFIDSGRTGASAILAEAIRLINETKENAKVITAFIPDGAFLDALIQADRRGVTVTLVATAPRGTLGVYRLVNDFSLLQLRMKRVGFRVLLSEEPIHAKLLITDDRTAFFGSHNFSTKGVIMRTAELALRSDDKTLVRNLLRFYHETAEKI